MDQGRIAIVDRGTCGFQIKVNNLNAAGAAAVLVANNAPGNPVTLGATAGQPNPTIPAGMVSVTSRSACTPSG